MFRTAAGYFFLQLSIIGLAVNLGVLFPISKLMKKGDKHCVYIIAVITIFNDTINLLVNCCYFAPTIISSSYILGDSPDSPGPLAMVSLAHFSWYNGLFVIIIMAINRITFSVFKKTDFFTQKLVFVFVLISVLFSCAKVLVDIFVLPCCLTVMDYEKFGLVVMNPKNDTNWAHWIDLPIEITVFAFTVISYIVIFIKIRMSNSNVDQSMDSKQLKKIRAREKSVAVQFASISVFSMLSFAALKFTPMIFGKANLESNIIPPIFFAMNCCANGFIYIFMNEEINEDIMKRIFKSNSVHTSGQDPNNPNAVRFEQPDFII